MSSELAPGRSVCPSPSPPARSAPAPSSARSISVSSMAREAAVPSGAGTAASRAIDETEILRADDGAGAERAGGLGLGQTDRPGASSEDIVVVKHRWDRKWVGQGGLRGSVELDQKP